MSLPYPTPIPSWSLGTMVGAIKKGVYSVLGYNMSTEGGVSGRQQRQLQRGTHRLLRQPPSTITSTTPSSSSSSSFILNEQRHQNNHSISWNGSTSTIGMNYENIPMTVESSSLNGDDYSMCLESQPSSVQPASDLGVQNNPGNGHVPISTTDHSTDSICSVALMVTLGPLNTQAHPWSDMGVFDGYEKVLRDLLLQDIKTALLSLTTSTAVTTTSSTTTPIAKTTATAIPITTPPITSSATVTSTTIPGTAASTTTPTATTTATASSPLVEVSIAGLEPLYSEEETWATSNGIQNLPTHPNTTFKAPSKIPSKTPSKAPSKIPLTHLLRHHLTHPLVQLLTHLLRPYIYIRYHAF